MKPDTKEIAVITRKMQPVLAEAEATEITDAKSMENAAGILSELNRMGDFIKAKREKYTVPLNQVLKSIREQFSPNENAVKDAVAGLRKKMSVYQTEATRLAEVEEKKISDRIGEGKGKLKMETGLKKLTEIERPDTKVVTAEGSVRFRSVKTLKILDESKIPREYFDLNHKKVLDALKDGTKVTGATIEIIKEPINDR